MPQHLTIVRFEDAAPIDSRVKFFDGKTWVASQSDAMDYASDLQAVTAFDKILPPDSGVEIALIQDYGEIFESLVDRKAGR